MNLNFSRSFSKVLLAFSAASFSGAQEDQVLPAKEDSALAAFLDLNQISSSAHTELLGGNSLALASYVSIVIAGINTKEIPDQELRSFVERAQVFFGPVFQSLKDEKSISQKDIEDGKRLFKVLPPEVIIDNLASHIGMIDVAIENGIYRGSRLSIEDLERLGVEIWRLQRREFGSTDKQVSEFVGSFPDKIPGAANIKVQHIEGAQHVLIDIKQLHRKEAGDESDEELARTARIQKNIGTIMHFLKTECGLNWVYVEGLSEGRVRIGEDQGASCYQIHCPPEVQRLLGSTKYRIELYTPEDLQSEVRSNLDRVRELYASRSGELGHADLMKAFQLVDRGEWQGLPFESCAHLVVATLLLSAKRQGAVSDGEFSQLFVSNIEHRESTALYRVVGWEGLTGPISVTALGEKHSFTEVKVNDLLYSPIDNCHDWALAHPYRPITIIEITPES